MLIVNRQILVIIKLYKKSMKNIYKKIFIRYALSAFLSVIAITTPAWGAPVLTITPITWDIIGLDSNNVNVGPNMFPIGVRVCNTGTSPATNVTTSFFTDGVINPYITMLGFTNLTVPSIPNGPVPLSQYTINYTPANCSDFYFEAVIARNSLAYNTTQGYHITTTADGLGTLSTPVPRQIFVQQLISQNRNSITSFTGPTTVYVGGTYTYNLLAKTATGGYGQFESYPTFPNTIFRIASSSALYTAPVGAINSTVYADACGWDPNPLSATYNSCIGPVNYVGGKAGGTITSTFTVKIVSTGVATVSNFVHDFSGASYHYNSDYGLPISTLTITALPSLAASKSFTPSATFINASSSLKIVLTNYNPASVLTGASFTDIYPAGLVNYSTLNLTNTCGGTVSAIPGGNSLSLSGGSVPASGSCFVSVNVMSAASGTYLNQTGLVTSDNSNDASSSAIFVVSSNPQMSVVKTVENASRTLPNNGSVASPGETLKYTITASVAVTTAYNIYVEDIIDPSLIYISGSEVFNFTNAPLLSFKNVEYYDRTLPVPVLISSTSILPAPPVNNAAIGKVIYRFNGIMSPPDWFSIIMKGVVQ